MNETDGPFIDQHAHLFGAACDGCTLTEICGEVDAGWACPIDPDAFGPGYIHPIRDSFGLLNELAMPAPPKSWGSLPSPAIFIPVTNLSLGGLTARDLRSVLEYLPKVPKSQAALLTGTDDQLEVLWANLGHWVKRIAQRDALAIGPSFSTWITHPPVQGLVAIKRSVEVARLLAAKVPTIPSVVWRTRLDIRRQVAWFRECWPSAIHVYFSTMKRAKEWSSFLLGIRYLAAELVAHGPLPILAAQGPSTVPRLREVLEAWPAQVVFITERPARLAIGGRRLRSDLSHERDHLTSFEALERANIRTFESAVRAAVIQQSELKGMPPNRALLA